MNDISATTRVAAVIGWPVGHSLSPVIHNAGFRSSGIDAVYVAFAVAPGEARGALDAARRFDLLGLSVTMPHKSDVARLVDEISPAAASLDSVNTVQFSHGRSVGHSTDGDGLVASMADTGVSVDGSRILVIGAGGAARSVVDAMRRHGAAGVVVANRTVENATTAARLGPADTRAVSLDHGLAEHARSSDIIINCTSIGMGSSSDGGDLPISPDLLESRHVVVDLVYHPLVTPLLRVAGEVGCHTVGGLGMLIHQAALQQEIWTGRQPDISAMTDAARQALG